VASGCALVLNACADLKGRIPLHFAQCLVDILSLLHSLTPPRLQILTYTFLRSHLPFAEPSGSEQEVSILNFRHSLNNAKLFTSSSKLSLHFTWALACLSLHQCSAVTDFVDLPTASYSYRQTISRGHRIVGPRQLNSSPKFTFEIPTCNSSTEGRLVRRCTVLQSQHPH
jgi:hypothetical protein